MESLHTQLLVRAPHVRETMTPDGAVLLDPIRGKTYSLDPTSALIWTHVVHGMSASEIAEKLAAQCNVDLTAVNADVSEFILSLVREELVFTKSGPRRTSPPTGLLSRLLGKLRPKTNHIE